MNRLRAPAWLPRLIAFARFVRAGRLALIFTTLGLLLAASLLESTSILLLIPALALLDQRTGALVVDPPIFGPTSIALEFILLSIVVLVAAQSLVTRSKNLALSDLAYSVVDKLRMDLFLAISRARWDFVSTQRTADLTHVMTLEIDRSQAATHSLITAAQNAVLILIYGALSLLVSPVLTLASLGVGLIALIVMRPLRTRAAKHGDVSLQLRRVQQRTVTDLLSGLKVAKSFAAEHRYTSALESSLHDVRSAARRFTALVAGANSILQVLGAALVAIFVFLALRQFSVPIERVLVVLVILLRVTPRITTLGDHLNHLLVSLPAFEAIRQMTRLCDDAAEPPADAARLVRAPQTAIAFEGVSYAYSTAPSRLVLKNVSCAFPVGEISAVIGPSGAGKSTLADIVLGLLRPQSGALLLDGQALTDADAMAWRRLTAYVPQDTFLFQGTIGDNLRLGAPTAKDEDLWGALVQSSAHQFVERLPAGLATPVGERGAQLSGGERQRLALARALLRKPAVLVLDEPTSALDEINQNLISASLRQLTPAITVIVVSHQSVLTALADTIVTVDDGRVTSLVHVANRRASAIIAPGAR